MSDEKNIHFHDIEFNELLKVIVIDLFSKYEKTLLDNNIISYEDKFNETIGFNYDSLAEKFWILNKEDIRAFLVREKNYRCNGTNVWLDEPKNEDVDEFYEKLIEEFS